MSEKEALEQALTALERLMQIFRLERMLYLLAGTASLLLFVYGCYSLFSSQGPTSKDIVLLLGASGVSTACSSRVVYFLNKGFNLIEDITRKQTGVPRRK